MCTPLLSQHSQTGPWNSLASQSSLTMILQANERPCTHKPRWITSEKQNLHMASGSYTRTHTQAHPYTRTTCACVDVCEYRYSYKFLVGRTQLYSSVCGWVQLQFGVILALFTATGLISTWYFSKDAPRGILLSSRCWGMWLLDQCPHESLVGNARVHSEVSSHKVPAYPTSQSRD